MGMYVCVFMHGSLCIHVCIDVCVYLFIIKSKNNSGIFLSLYHCEINVEKNLKSKPKEMRAEEKPSY